LNILGSDFNNGCVVPKLPPEVVDLLAFRRGSDSLQPAESLALLKASIKIKNSSLR
jgi:hypothetical protein